MFNSEIRNNNKGKSENADYIYVTPRVAENESIFFFFQSLIFSEVEIIDSKVEIQGWARSDRRKKVFFLLLEIGLQLLRRRTKSKMIREFIQGCVIIVDVRSIESTRVSGGKKNVGNDTSILKFLNA